MRKITNILLVMIVGMTSIIAQDKTDIYEACCGAEPVEILFKDNKGRDNFVFIPNVFTPNKDSINDMFRPYTGDGVIGVMYFEVYYEPESKDTSKILLYRAREFSSKEFEKKGWDGTNLEGEPYTGPFSYSIYFYTEDDAFLLRGKACAVACDERAKIFQKKEGCFFPQQVGDDNRLDRDKEVRESECFGK